MPEMDGAVIMPDARELVGQHAVKIMQDFTSPEGLYQELIDAVNK